MSDPRIRILRLNATLTGVGAGVVAALGLFVATNWLLLKGGEPGEPIGPHLVLLAQFLPGYRMSVAGSFIGAAWAFVWAFAAGYGVSRIYNLLVRNREAP